MICRSCKGQNVELREFTNQGGGKALHEQCLDCGAKAPNAVKREWGRSYLPADEGLWKRWRDGEDPGQGELFA
jgi:hypothetical protein